MHGLNHRQHHARRIALSRPPLDVPRRPLVILLVIALALSGLPFISGSAETLETRHYIVVFDGTQAADGTFQLLGNYALNHSVAMSAIAAAGGTVQSDLTRQIGVAVVASTNSLFADAMRNSGLVTDVAEDYSWKGVPTIEDAVAAGAVVMSRDEASSLSGSEQSADQLKALQWDMEQIRAFDAHNDQLGWRAVDVGVLDTGIDGYHLEFSDTGVPGGPSNVDCARGRNSISFIIENGPGVGVDDPCVDNGFHGTHVAGTIAAQANGVGMVGVAPNVTLVPVKVCDTSGHCYASAVVDGITYAGDIQLDVINMSFFVDDDAFLESTEFKCMSDPVQRTFRRAVERAMQYARKQGVTPVAALGNSDNDLANPPEPYTNACDVVPAETSGVIGTMSLGRNSQKASYSNYGSGPTDVAAPGGSGRTGDCTTTIFSTFPGNSYFCIQGTSMASPHAAGVAALIVSQFGTAGSDGDVRMSPTSVEAQLTGTAVDIGLPGYDMCFGHGRVDALRAVHNDTSTLYDASAPFCPEYDE